MAPVTHGHPASVRTVSTLGTPRPGSPGAPLWDPDAVPAATVVVLRDGAAGLEVLLLRRDRSLSFAGGMWVFPGGRIDPADHPDDADGGDPSTPTPAGLELAARTAAVREAAEEAGLVLEPSSLRRWTQWTPPPESPKRFSTAFFVAPLDAAVDVVVDDGEIREHRWLAPDEALRRRDAGEVGLSPPTFVTLHQLRAHAGVDDVLAHAATITTPEHFATRIAVRDEQILALYHGDAGYETGDPDLEGPRHRLRMADTWHYERDS